MAAERIRVASFASLREGVGTSVRVQDMEIALFRRGSSVYAIENLCPHQHIPVLDEGELDGNIITCPMHGWRYDITDGRCVHASSRLTTFSVSMDGDDVYIELPEEEQEPWW
ncbi:Rieske (2Fe-2S) protein [bacterium]|nr:Rieske (2Fe-2S) protein [bacterium]